MDKLQVDFRTHSRTLSGDRGVFYDTSNRAIVILPNHECFEDIISTIQHESIHFCLKDDDSMDDWCSNQPMEYNRIYDYALMEFSRILLKRVNEKI